MKPFQYLCIHVIVCIVLLLNGHAKRLEKRFEFQTLQSPKPQVCYDGLGCFKQDYPFVSIGRPVYFPPASPKQIGTQFLLYTRENHNVTQFLVATNETSITTSNFRGTRRTSFVIHGFTSSGYSDWVVAMTQELLANSDVNVIAVNWANGAEFPYIQATSNIRVVAAQIAQLLGVLKTLKQCRPEDVYIIGHSLGAHMAGYVGQRVANISRITGLEPAGLLFTENIPKLRLFRTDATFVDIIHTNCEKFGFGLCDQLGHADYYVNNAEFQPGCIDDSEEVYGNIVKLNKEEITTTEPSEPLSCSHHRSIDYFIESINEPCFYWSFECPNLDTLALGDCWSCDVGVTCNRMGFHAVQVKYATNRTYVVTTGDTAPFCRNYYKVDYKTGFNQSSTVGKVSINAVANHKVSGKQPKNKTLTFVFPSSEISTNETKKHLFQDRQQVYNFSSSEVTFQKNAPAQIISFAYSNMLSIFKVGIQTLNEFGQIKRTDLCNNATLNSVNLPTATFLPNLCTIVGSTTTLEFKKIEKESNPKAANKTIS